MKSLRRVPMEEPSTHMSDERTVGWGWRTVLFNFQRLGVWSLAVGFLLFENLVENVARGDAGRCDGTGAKYSAHPGLHETAQRQRTRGYTHNGARAAIRPGSPTDQRPPITVLLRAAATRRSPYQRKTHNGSIIAAERTARLESNGEPRGSDALSTVLA